MAFDPTDTITPNLGLRIPLHGHYASDGWDTPEDFNLNQIDSSVLPIAGGTITGNLTVNGTSNVGGNGSIGGTATIGSDATINGNLTVNGSTTTVNYMTAHNTVTADTVNVGNYLNVGNTVTINADIHANNLYCNGNINCSGSGNVTAPYIHSTGAVQVDSNLVSNGFVKALGGAQIYAGCNLYSTGGSLNCGYIDNVGTVRAFSQWRSTDGYFLFVNNIGGGWFAMDQSNQFWTSAGNCYKPGGGSWANSSDERIKRDIEPYQSGLKELERLEPVEFAYNGQGGMTDDGKRYVGLIAQAAQRAMPELVHEIAGDFEGKLPGQLGLDTSNLIFALINAVKELSAKVERLEQKQELSAKVERLEQKR